MPKTTLTITGSNAKCPLCGARIGCWDGLRIGSTLPCECCPATLTVSGSEGDPRSADRSPVFMAAVKVTDRELQALKLRATVPVVPVDGRDRQVLDRLCRKGLMEKFSPWVGFMTKGDVALQLPRGV